MLIQHTCTYRLSYKHRSDNKIDCTSNGSTFALMSYKVASNRSIFRVSRAERSYSELGTSIMYISTFPSLKITNFHTSHNSWSIVYLYRLKMHIERHPSLWFFLEVTFNQVCFSYSPKVSKEKLTPNNQNLLVALFVTVDPEITNRLNLYLNLWYYFS